MSNLWPGDGNVQTERETRDRQRQDKIEDLNDSAHPNKVTLADVKAKRR